MVTLNGQALSKIFSRETGPFIITFVFIKNLTDSKQNTVIQTFVRRIPLYFTSTCCHLILTVMMMIMMMMIFSLVLQSKSSLGLLVLTFLGHTQLDANTQ
jgi:hypothetical protein